MLGYTDRDPQPLAVAKPLKILITGRPGVGKTTLFSRVLSDVEKNSYSIAGFICPEVRVGGSRVGFRIVDLLSGASGWLAMAMDRLGGSCTGPRIGRYCVIVSDVSRVVSETLGSLDSADLVAIDEIGPMELAIEISRKVIDRALAIRTPGVFVVHIRLVDQIVSEVKGYGYDYKLYHVDPSNRDRLYHEISEEILRIIGRGKTI